MWPHLGAREKGGRGRIQETGSRGGRGEEVEFSVRGGRMRVNDCPKNTKHLADNRNPVSENTKRESPCDVSFSCCGASSVRCYAHKAPALRHHRRAVIKALGTGLHAFRRVLEWEHDALFECVE